MEAVFICRIISQAGVVRSEAKGGKVKNHPVIEIAVRQNVLSAFRCISKMAFIVWAKKGQLITQMLSDSN